LTFTSSSQSFKIKIIYNLELGEVNLIHSSAKAQMYFQVRYKHAKTAKSICVSGVKIWNSSLSDIRIHSETTNFKKKFKFFFIYLLICRVIHKHKISFIY